MRPTPLVPLAAALLLAALSLPPRTATPPGIRLTLTVVPGPASAPPPSDLLAAWVGILPERTDSALGAGAEERDAIATLDSLRGAARTAARQRRELQGRAGLGRRSPYGGLEFVAMTPDIRGPLIRRYVERRGWSAVTRQANAILTLARGSGAETEVLPSDGSLALGQLLRAAGALDAVVVDLDGAVVAATAAGFVPSLHGLPEWAALAGATGDAILVTPPWPEPGTGDSMRRVAVPIHASGDSVLIGWVLAVVPAAP